MLSSVFKAKKNQRLNICLSLLYFVCLHFNFGDEDNCPGKRITLEWNNSLLPEEFYRSYCPYRCRANQIVQTNNIHNMCPNIVCPECSCKKPECQFYGICCPEFSETIDTVYADLRIPGTQDIFYTYPQTLDNREGSVEVNWTTLLAKFVPPPKLGCGYYTSFNIFEATLVPMNLTFLYIRSCPSDYSGISDVVRQCEDEVPPDKVTIDNFAWVEDLATGLVYRNHYCAICNGALQATTSHENQHHMCRFMSLYHVTDWNVMLRVALDTTSCCTVTRSFPGRVRAFPCDPRRYSNDVIKSCAHASPDWQFNLEIAWEARDVMNESYHVVVSAATEKCYQNIFCAMSMRHNGNPSYELHSVCPRQGWLRIIDSLINIRGIRLKEDEPDVRDLLSYNGKHWTLPSFTKCVYDPQLNYMLDTRIARSTMRSGFLRRTVPCGGSNNASRSTVIAHWLDFNFTAEPLPSRDELEDELVTVFFQHEMEIQVGDSSSALFRAEQMLPRFTDEHFCSRSPARVSGNSLTCAYNEDEARGESPEKNCGPGEEGYVKVATTLLCRYVTFMASEYTVTVEYNGGGVSYCDGEHQLG
ncbi:hypothetical protein Btru_025303 [Bulinus truncatus]|nr:hypothetical protein Btru_025303 [Bulinus truncatus]